MPSLNRDTPVPQYLKGPGPEIEILLDFLLSVSIRRRRVTSKSPSPNITQVQRFGVVREEEEEKEEGRHFSPRSRQGIAMASPLRQSKRSTNRPTSPSSKTFGAADLDFFGQGVPTGSV